MIEYEATPGEPGPPPHVHRTFEEAWYILEGEVVFVANGSEEHAGPGTYVYVPRGTPHAFRVAGANRARWIGVFSPGRYVALLEELGMLLRPGAAPDLEAVARLFAKYDSAIVDRA